MQEAAVIAAAFAADRLFGDPQKIYHPVSLIGKLTAVTEKALRSLLPQGIRWQILGGGLLWIWVISLSFSMPFLILMLAKSINIWFAYSINGFWCWQIFAAKSLRDAGREVYGALKKGDIEGARRSMAHIVGRDTAALDFQRIAAGTVETVAENTSDAVIAPMMFMIIGGAPLGFLYKAVNTMDSMVGYKNERYIYFGKIPAKADDVFNFFPARLTAVFFIIGTLFFRGLSFKGSLRIYLRDRKNHTSPNCGHPESAVAGALGVRLGGDAYYFGKLYKKKTIGDKKRDMEAEDIIKTDKLMYTSSAMALAVFALIRTTLTLFI